MGDRNFVGRGFSADMRSLTPWEKQRIEWQLDTRPRPIPKGFSCPGNGFFESWYPRTIASGDEKMLLAPSWLFTAESSSYKVARGILPTSMGWEGVVSVQVQGVEEHVSDRRRVSVW